MSFGGIKLFYAPKYFLSLISKSHVPIFMLCVCVFVCVCVWLEIEIYLRSKHFWSGIGLRGELTVHATMLISKSLIFRKISV